MQLHLTLDEIQLAVDILEQRNRELTNEISRTDNIDFKRELQTRERLLDELENRLIKRELQLSADELDLLAAELDRYGRELTVEEAHTNHTEFRQSLENRRALMEHLRDKVVEACAMA